MNIYLTFNRNHGHQLLTFKSLVAIVLTDVAERYHFQLEKNYFQGIKWRKAHKYKEYKWRQVRRGRYVWIKTRCVDGK
jgi:hypothetical protein